MGIFGGLRVGVVCTVLGIGAAALAHSGAMGIVKERMDAMSAMGKAMKALSAEAKRAEPDWAAAQAAGALLERHGGAAMVAQFPEGSGGGVSEATAAVWADPAGFAALAMDLQAEGAALGQMTSGDLQAQVRRIGQVCARCHEGYRVKK